MTDKESDALHTLRLIYADLMESAARSRARAEAHSIHGETHAAAARQRDCEVRSACAARVKFYCYKIGFDPSKGELHESIREKSEDA